MSNTPLLLPCLRCTIGDWVYYVTSLCFSEIAGRVHFAKEIHKSQALNEQLQRDLNPRAEQIAKYILTTEQRFFNALTVAVYGGEPEWLDISLLSSRNLDLTKLDPDTEERIDSTLGLLRLSGTEHLFALDGQHRVSGIRQALSEKAELALEEVCVIFVGHQNTDEGMVRSRRLFTTLNRYAKPVSKVDIVALDEDDASAIITRRLLNDHPLLTGVKTTTGIQTSIPRTDPRSFTTIVSVYEICNILLTNNKVGATIWRTQALRGPRPDDADLDALFVYCRSFWDALSTSFPALKELADSDPKSTTVAGKYRSAAGGNLLFRPIGQTAFARAVRTLINSGDGVVEAVKRLNELDLELSQKPWLGVLWNSASNTMTHTKTHRDIAADLMVYYIGGPTDKSKLLKRYRALLDAPRAKLPSRPASVLGAVG